MVSTRTGGKIQAVIFRCKEKPEVLILHYRPEHGSFWQTVSGNVELNEDLLDSLIREVKEETGLGKECIINVYPDIYSFDFHAHDMDFHETVFAVMVRPDCNVDISRNVD
ncbi:hypothetical protein [Thermoplasma volcanium GSS1]|uniref:Nudix hydrolase domain-containing protein n=1 Tax=Thermoplasma volcanium (strain ATCC 51530 / DSM 4299 / JCM 9571 / NBRC 15438 / GSS1) TaxID=273116 RepID=Q97C43_THEVO|nr:NUDIX domain-containing protein [Thermoplasma volcanium]BAB59404.1 hypothetical protein [Thermoplasma volcanium GSS1]